LQCALSNRPIASTDKQNQISFTLLQVLQGASLTVMGVRVGVVLKLNQL